MTRQSLFIAWISKNADGIGAASFADGATLEACQASIAHNLTGLQWHRFPNGAVVSIRDKRNRVVESKRHFEPTNGPSTFISGHDDMQWLADVHLSSLGDNCLNGSAILYGNEDCPARIEVYNSADPLVTDKPLTYVLTDNGYKLV